jgi:hypothetical protein
MPSSDMTMFRSSGNGWRVRVLAVGAVVVTAGAVVAVALASSGSPSCPTRADYRAFRASTPPSDVRERIGQRIRRCNGLDDLSRRQVHKMLGRTSMSDPGGDLWELGSDGFLDSHQLVVAYDARGRVKNVRIAST